MANVKISELSALTTPAAADLFVVVDDSEASSEKTKYITYANFQDAILADATELPMAIGGTDQIKLVDGVLQPVTDNDVDLGATSYQFKNIYLEGSVIQNGVNKKIWKNSPSTASSSTFSGLSLGKMYSCKFRLASSTPTTILARFNNDSGTDYIFTRHLVGESAGSDTESVFSQSGYTYIALAGISADSVGSFDFYIATNTSFNGSSFSYQDTNDWSKTNFAGYYTGGTVSSLVVFVASGTMTGEIWLEEMD